MTDRARDVMEAFSGISICSVCNNGILPNGWYVGWIAVDTSMHCTTCHESYTDRIHTCLSPPDHDSNIYAHCPKCGDIVSQKRGGLYEMRRWGFFTDHQCS